MPSSSHGVCERCGRRWLFPARRSTIILCEACGGVVAPVRSKYGNQRAQVNGKKFASKAEAARYRELLLLEKSGEIRDLRCQVGYPLEVNGERVGVYVADFTYEEKDGSTVTEDTKGFLTDVYKLKKKLMKAIYGIEIVEIRATKKGR